MKNSESKFTDFATENLQLYHNVGASLGAAATHPYKIWTNLLSVGQGTGNGQRVGDKIYSRSLYFKCWLSTKQDRPNVMYRLLVLQWPESVYGSTYNGQNQRIFYALDNGYAMTEHIDRHTYKVVYDKIIQPIRQSGIPATQKEHSYLHRFRIKTNRKVTYKDDSAGVTTNNPMGQQNSMAFYIIPYDAYGTLVTDNIASCGIVMRHYYKDL